MARGGGRPIPVLVLSNEERFFFERQARRRHVAPSMPERCRMILRCAERLANEAVAVEFGVRQHTVGKHRRGPEAVPPAGTDAARQRDRAADADGRVAAWQISSSGRSGVFDQRPRHRHSPPTSRTTPRDTSP